jgi:hypothetical protein
MILFEIKCHFLVPVSRKRWEGLEKKEQVRRPAATNIAFEAFGKKGSRRLVYKIIPILVNTLP